jgi:Reverse transcriptase (RNA-dependent DNA polymerase)
MNDKIKSIKKNETWKLTKLPKNSRPIGVKWVFKKKNEAQGELERYKARLIVKGYK